MSEEKIEDTSFFGALVRLAIAQKIAENGDSEVAKRLLSEPFPRDEPKDWDADFIAKVQAAANGEPL